MKRRRAGPWWSNMRDMFIQLYPDEYHDFADYLAERGFERFQLGAPASRSMNKPQLAVQYLSGLSQLMFKLGLLRDVRTLIIFGRFAYAVKLLARLRLLRYERLLCFGFFVHEPRLFRVFRQLARLDGGEDHYVIFSRSETELYHRVLGIDRHRMHFVPLGDWSQRRQPTGPMPATGDYYFAGGRSNREHRTLIEAFRSIPAPLVIICGESNLQEFDDIELPSNISVHCDVTTDVFEDFVRRAKIGLIPLKHDTGSSGQSVALSLMRNAKGIIASDVGVLRDYVEQGVSGYLLSNFAAELPAIIDHIEQRGLAPELGRASRSRYEGKFSRAATIDAFEKVLDTL